MILRKTGLLASAAVLAVGLAACGSSKKSSGGSGAAAGTISGAGSTFAAPVYDQWASAQSGLTVNYQAVGSGAGITALESRTVDFGASDPPLKPADESAVSVARTIVDLPTPSGPSKAKTRLPRAALMGMSALGVRLLTASGPQAPRLLDERMSSDVAEFVRRMVGA